jgi:hypothetical protein
MSAEGSAAYANPPSNPELAKKLAVAKASLLSYPRFPIRSADVDSLRL